MSNESIFWNFANWCDPFVRGPNRGRIWATLKVIQRIPSPSPTHHNTQFGDVQSMLTKQPIPAPPHCGNSHETSAGFYRVSSYFFAKILSEVLPVKALPAFIFMPIIYVMAGLRRSWRAFFYWQLSLTLLTITSSGVAFSISAMVSNARIGAMLLSMFFVLMMVRVWRSESFVSSDEHGKQRNWSAASVLLNWHIILGLVYPSHSSLYYRSQVAF